MSESNTTVEVAISNPSNGRGDTWVDVRICDGPSRMPLAEFRMDPAEWYGLLHGGMRSNVPAFVTAHVHRIGKQYEAATRPAPKVYNHELRDADHAEIIAATDLPDGWDGFDHARVNRTNSGLTVTFMRWLEVSA